MKKWNTVTLAYGGLMSALAIVLSYIEIPVPLFFPAPWLKLDLSFVPMMLAGLALGPTAGVAALAITNAFHLLGSSSAGVGELANMIVGACFLLPALVAYRINRTRKNALWGMAAGVLLMIAGGVASNFYILIPFYFGDALAGFDMRGYLTAAVVPFNLLKGIVDSVIISLLYKRMSGILKKAKLERDNKNAQPA